jgi:hypothetical protein
MKRTVLGFIACVCALGLAAAAQSSGLRILVVEGEDAVNIIQQKTAVAPVVEVRDRNDLPVSGASVVFLIGGKGARFAGNATRLQVATDASGRATASGLEAVGKGAVRIQVQASYEGQTAGATITQTNVATAADAAQAGNGVSSSNNSTTQARQGVSQGSHHVGLIAGAGAAAGGVVAAKRLGVFDDGPLDCREQYNLLNVTDPYIFALQAFSQCVATTPSPGACNPAAATLQSSVQAIRSAVDQLCACFGVPSDSAQVTTPDAVIRGGAGDSRCGDGKH